MGVVLTLREAALYPELLYADLRREYGVDMRTTTMRSVELVALIMGLSDQSRMRAAYTADMEAQEIVAPTVGSDDDLSSFSTLTEVRG